MNQGRIIKKYPNRRLYDTQQSRYITLTDIRRLVVDGSLFSVIDQRTNEDITRCVLLQVISEQENDDQCILSREFLCQIIRAYSVQNMAGHTWNDWLALQQQFLDDLPLRDIPVASGNTVRPV